MPREKRTLPKRVKQINRQELPTAIGNRCRRVYESEENYVSRKGAKALRTNLILVIRIKTRRHFSSIPLCLSAFARDFSLLGQMAWRWWRHGGCNAVVHVSVVDDSGAGAGAQVHRGSPRRTGGKH